MSNHTRNAGVIPPGSAWANDAGMLRERRGNDNRLKSQTEELRQLREENARLLEMVENVRDDLDDLEHRRGLDLWLNSQMEELTMLREKDAAQQAKDAAYQQERDAVLQKEKERQERVAVHRQEIIAAQRQAREQRQEREVVLQRERDEVWFRTQRSDLRKSRKVSIDAKDTKHEKEVKDITQETVVKETAEEKEEKRNAKDDLNGRKIYALRREYAICFPGALTPTYHIPFQFTDVLMSGETERAHERDVPRISVVKNWNKTWCDEQETYVDTDA